MHISALDLYRIGIGPSSSHTMGPMKAARIFASELPPDLDFSRLRVELFGSLGLTGKGHGTDKAVTLGLTGESPDSVPIEKIPGILESIRNSGKLLLACEKKIAFEPSLDLVFHCKESLPEHANGMRFSALDAKGAVSMTRVLLHRRWICSRSK